MDDYIRFPLKWLGAELESIKKVRFGFCQTGENINGIFLKKPRFGSFWIKSNKEYKFKNGQIGWEVKYVNKRTKKEVIQIWTEVNIDQWNKFFGMVLSETKQYFNMS